jgi:hypothetical protein
MDSATRTLFLVGALVAVAGLAALAVAQLADVRWLIIPAAVLGLVAARRCISGRRRPKGD